MSTIIAIAHVLGTIIAVFAFSAAVLALSAWELKRNQKAATKEVSIALGIPVESLDNAENSSKVVTFTAARFSSDLFRNRLSDLCGWVQIGWVWLGTLLQVGVFIGVIWYSVTDSAQNAVHAWWVVGIAVFFWIVSVAFGLLCKLVTGRFPGQARQARKQLAEYVRNQSAKLTGEERFMQNAKGVLDLDERLIRAVFEPARIAGVFEGSELPWESLDSSCSADDLIALLLPLSEYYQAINPPLSTALWGIWNASQSFRRQRSLLSMLFERKFKDANVFAEVKG
ncbi:MAG: hypothetical protein ACRER2_07520, partial [Methylococcales bacterium]